MWLGNSPDYPANLDWFVELLICWQFFLPCATQLSEKCICCASCCLPDIYVFPVCVWSAVNSPRLWLAAGAARLLLIGRLTQSLDPMTTWLDMTWQSEHNRPEQTHVFFSCLFSSMFIILLCSHSSLRFSDLVPNWSDLPQMGKIWDFLDTFSSQNVLKTDLKVPDL